jgi:hypothetical protein
MRRVPAGKLSTLRREFEVEVQHASDRAMVVLRRPVRINAEVGNAAEQLLKRKR